jgi:coatomer protein complex subunit gamma
LQSALRQMVYLVIKELSHIAEDVIMVTSSIMKDMQPNLEVIYRPNAIRALCRVTDVSRLRAPVPRARIVTTLHAHRAR